MVLAYGFSKAKIQRGWSFPLKRSVLDASLMAAGVSRILSVTYGQRQSGHVVMWANYCGEGRRGWAGAGLASIIVYAVPSTERQATEIALVSEALPRLVRWLSELESSGNTRRGVDQHFHATFEAGVLGVTMS